MYEFTIYNLKEKTQALEFLPKFEERKDKGYDSVKMW